jgi:phage tail-like protein
MADPELLVNTHVTLTMGDAGTVEGFYQFDMPSSTLQAPEQFVWDGNGAPQKVTTTALAQWTPVSGSRYLSKDAASTLWGAYEKAIQNPKTAKGEYQLAICDKEGAPQITWSLEGAYVSAYSTTSQSAGGNEIASIKITVTYDNAKPA